MRDSVLGNVIRGVYWIARRTTNSSLVHFIAKPRLTLVRKTYR